MRSISSRLILGVLVLTLAIFLMGCQSSFVRSAKIYIQQEDNENAKKILLDGAKVSPEDAELFYVLGKVHADLDEWTEMIAAFDKAQSLTSEYDEDIRSTKRDNWRRVFNSAVKPFNASEYEKAVDKFKTALIILPKDVETNKRIGLCYLQMQDLDNAEKFLKITISLDEEKTDLGTRYNLIGLFSQQERWENIIELADEIIELNDNLADDNKFDMTKLSNVISRKAVAYQKMEQKEKAIETWDEAIAKNPGVADFHYNKAILLHSMEKWEEAAEEYLMVLEITPDDDEARLNVARALFTPQKWDILVDVLEGWLFPTGEVVEYDPEIRELDAWIILRAAYQNLGQENKSLVVTKILMKLQQEG